METAGFARTFPLNTAQLRNLKNWVGEIPSKTLTMVFPVTRTMRHDEARTAVLRVMRAHEALRSRIVAGSSGPMQEVAPPENAEAMLAWDVADLPADAPALWAQVPVPAMERALCGVAYLRGDRVVAVKLSVSHVFTDALGTAALARDLRRLLDDGRPAHAATARQPAAYACDPTHPVVQKNTDFWKQLLANAPRSCTYSGTARESWETAQVASVPLGQELAGQVARACQDLRVTPNALWTSVLSALVGLLSGQHRHVMRSTYANRFTPADFRAVAQLAQAVFLPVAGTADESLRDRVGTVARSFRATYDKGLYDANDVLDWLNRPERSRGVLFQPAFELNYLPKLPTEMVQPFQENAEVKVRIDPPAAKADLSVSVTDIPDPVLKIEARRPISRRRGVRRLAEDCLTVLRALCADPDTPIRRIPVQPFTVGHINWHHSGTAVDLECVRELVMSVDGVSSCELELIGERLRAVVSGGKDPTAMTRMLRERQPWWSGAVVPDELVVGT